MKNSSLQLDGVDDNYFPSLEKNLELDVLIIGGGIIGFFLVRYFMMKYFKKNPPINEEMIKTLMMQMGRKPSQKQVNQMMKSMQKFM